MRASGTVGYTPIAGSFDYPAGEDLTTGVPRPRAAYQWIVEAYQGATLLEHELRARHVHYRLRSRPPPTGAPALTGNKITGNAGATPDTCAATLPSECQNLRQTPVLSWDADPNAASTSCTSPSTAR